MNSDSWIVTIDENNNYNVVDNKLLNDYALKADVNPSTGSKQLNNRKWNYNNGIVPPRYSPGDLIELLDYNTYHADCVDAVAGDSAGISYTLNPVEGLIESEEERVIFKEFLDRCTPSINDNVFKMIYDRRAIGYGALEVTRFDTSDSMIRRLCHIPSYTLRRHVDEKRVKQINEYGDTVWFVLYGENYNDDGVKCDVHSETGEWHPYNSLSASERANELLWTYEYAPKTSYYGRPPIIGALMDIQGSLSAKRFNNSFFKNYGMPAFAVTITGDFEDYSEQEYLDELDPNGNKIKNPDYDVTKTLRYKISRQIKEVIKNPHSAICITVPSEGEEGKVDVNIQPLSVQTEEGGFRLFLKDARDEIIHAHKVDPSRLGIYDAGKLNGTNAGFTDNSYKYSTVAPIKSEIETLINMIAKKELGVSTWEYKSNDLDPKDYANDLKMAEFLFQRAGITPRELIHYFGDKFGLTAPDNPYLDEYYLNNQPLRQLWDNVKDNPSLEAETILNVLNDNLWNPKDE